MEMLSLKQVSLLTNPMDALYPISLLLQELKNEDTRYRLNSAKKLPTIAAALGVERTRTELLPCLTEMAACEDDEIQMAVAEQLAGFSSLIGGAEHVKCLLAPLKALAVAEDTAVREKAVEALKGVSEEFNKADLEGVFVPFVRNLATDEWFTSRTSACGLISVCYQRCSAETRANLRHTYIQLCNDDAPMVRRAAARQLGDFARAVEPDHLKSSMVSVFRTLSSDEHDSVRRLVVSAGIAIASLLPRDDMTELVLPSLRSFPYDSSWPVRHESADLFLALQTAVGPEITETELLGLLRALLTDEEGEVRITATCKVLEFCQNLRKEKQERIILLDILPSIKELSADANSDVRLALAPTIMGLCSIIGKHNTIEHLLPIFLARLRDECPEVRLNIISNLEAVNKVIGVSHLTQSLMPAIIDLSKERNWRVRHAVVTSVPVLTQQLGRAAFDEKLCGLCAGWLEDPVAAVRDATGTVLRDMATTLGADWTREKVVPMLRELAHKPYYLVRISCIVCASTVTSACGSEVGTRLLLPIVCSLAEDKVPNVRFNVAKALQKMAPDLEPSCLVPKVKLVLEKLKLDTDTDVQYFASEALEKIVFKPS